MLLNIKNTITPRLLQYICLTDPFSIDPLVVNTILGFGHYWILSVKSISLSLKYLPPKPHKYKILCTKGLFHSYA